MKKILIPTDFTVESLQLVEYAVLNFPNTPLDIILLAGHKLPDTRWAVSHFNPREEVCKHFSEEFVAAKRQLLKEHKNQINSISCELFTGFNSYAFQNFLEKLDSVDAVVPKDNMLHAPHKKWFNTSVYIEKNVKNVIEVPVKLSEKAPHRKYSLINLLNI